MPALAITVKIIASLDKFADDFLFVFVELNEHCVSPCVVVVVSTLHYIIGANPKK